ncbi:MAG: Thermophilic serine proteinase precursor [Candidatus Latescibacteria bacterium ADurb.Bin168]|nr:MAG: Thermophilic serine proteinase precursor [Candidatus Latescibacteria bacterium ADurb.Bin168]
MLFAALSLFTGSAFCGEIPRFSPHTVLVRMTGGPAKPGFRGKELGLTDPEPLLPLRSRKPSANARPEEVGDWFKFRISNELSPQQVADSLNKIPGIVAQPNYLYRMLGTPPDDPGWQNQWGAQRIRLDEVWQQVQADAAKCPIIGIIDSGVDYRHPDLEANIWHNATEQAGLPGVDDDGNGYVDDFVGWDFTDSPGLSGLGDHLDRDNDPFDEMGHGTQVAGVAAAVTNNGAGIAGTAPNARIMCLRAGAQLINGSGYLEEDDIAAAVVYAVENGAEIINMSFGDIVSTPLMGDIVAYAAAARVVLIAAAGNENTPSLLFPAAYDETIAVGATGENDARATFSSYGENLDLCAPGVSIYTTNTYGAYRRNGGTSFSAPFVSGAAAILLSRAPHLSPTEVRSILCRGVVDIGPPGWDEQTGHGRLDLPTLLSVAQEPVAQILTPGRTTEVRNAVRWAVHVRGTPPVAWVLSYGVGAVPRVWTTCASGVLEAAGDTLSGTYSTVDHPDTLFCLRLTVTDLLGRTSEDRALYSLDRSPPVFRSQPVVLARWDGDVQRIFLQWETDDLTTGTVRIWRGAAAGSASLEYSVSATDRAHFEEIPRQDVDVGPFSVQVVARNVSGMETESAFSMGTGSAYALPRSGWDEDGALVGGILMPAGTGMPPLPDVDGNGIPEVVIKLAHRAPYDTVSFFELPPGSPPVLRTESPVKMRPAAVVDIDGNGTLDLIGFDYFDSAFRVRVVEIGQSSPWWERTSLVGPSVADVDGDGRAEIIAVVDSNRALLHVYEATGPGGIELKAVLQSPLNGYEGQFGIWRATGDFDGTGRNVVVAGTVGGAVVLFPSIGDDAFGVPRVIEGQGDATRVCAIGDVNNDGRDDFAIVRHMENTKFAADVAAFRLEVYTGGTTPFFVREFHDPRTEGNGFSSGDLGGKRVVVLAMPPHLYVLDPAGSGVDGFLYYGETDSPSQPLVADIDGQGGSELLFPRAGALAVLRALASPRAPAAPRNVSVRVRDSLSVVVSWNAEPGLRYRIWAGSGPDSLLSLRTEVIDPVPPVTLTFAPPLQSEIRVAVQAVNPAIADSLGGLSDTIAVRPHAGPRAIYAARVSPGGVDVRFDLPLNALETTERDFLLRAGTEDQRPSSLVRDRSGFRVLLLFRSGEWPSQDVVLSYDVRDTSGALGTGTIPVSSAPREERPRINFAMAIGSRTIRVAFDREVVYASLVADSITVLPRVAITGIEAVDGYGRFFDIHFGSALSPAQVYVFRFAGVRSITGEIFSTGVVVGGENVSSVAPRIVAVLQKSATELWLVLSAQIDSAKAFNADVQISPRVSVQETLPGEIASVLVVRIRPETPLGPWEETYGVTVRADLADGTKPLLACVFVPSGERPSTGRLRAVEVPDCTHLKLKFDLPIANAGQPGAAIRVEPGIQVLSLSVADSIVDVEVSEQTPVGSWGITYVVHVDGLLAVSGERLDELFVVRLAPPRGVDSVRVFPQPFRPTHHRSLVFGGLPIGATLQIYRLDGNLIRDFAPTETGGIAWDGKNENGAVVSSGVYFYVVSSPSGRRAGKIAVVR